MKKLLLMMMAGLLVTACASKPKTEQAAEEPAKKVLVLYYSVTNTTKQMAEYIQQKTGADIEAITPVNAYPTCLCRPHQAFSRRNPRQCPS